MSGSADGVPPQSGHAFLLDSFQLDAIAALDLGRSVLVAAPTGSGKTVVAEAAIDMALHAGGKVFYTTPIKALSNQKYVDLVRRLGVDRVGLLTGDVAVRGDASIVVMTTEVLRNMLYAASDLLTGLHAVVLDEVHYLQDAYRGPVWEEVILGLDPNVSLVCLSATVSNADELGRWIEAATGRSITTIVETERPVELHSLHMVSDRLSDVDLLFPVLVDGSPNDTGFRFDSDPRAARSPKGARGRRYRTPGRLEVIERLAEEDLLPSIVFVFSRNGCDDAAALARDSGIRLTTSEERIDIRRIVEASVAQLADLDLDALGYDEWLAGMEAGIAAHHAGLIPAYKEAVEQCFVRGLTKVVYATETLALGINMPARSVVIEKLTKYNGDGHDVLSPGQFTQLVGRAGRRGIDEVGHAVILWSPFSSFGQIVGLVTSRSFPLTSSFRPTYNMAANLIRRYDQAQAVALLGRSFAQYQADSALVDLRLRLDKDQGRQAALEADARCELGEIDDYVDLVGRLRAQRRVRPERFQVDRSLSLLRPGDVIVEPASGPDRRRVLVMSVAHRGRGALRLRAVDEHGDLVGIDSREVRLPVRAFAWVELPVPFAPHDRAFIDELAQLLRDCPVPTPPPERDAGTKADALRAARDAHPVHDCPDRDRHVDAVRSLTAVRRDIEVLDKQLVKRSGSVVRRFEALVDLLTWFNMVEGWALTAVGERLARTYHECDLLVVLVMEDGALDGLDAPSLAAVVSGLTYEERRPETAPQAKYPTDEVRRRFGRLDRVAAALTKAERARGLPVTRLPSPGFAESAYAWASGRELGELLDGDLSGGDFVRNTRLLVDLLRQIGDHAPDLGTRRAARAASVAMHRGVVDSTPTVTDGWDGPVERGVPTGPGV